MRSAGRRLRIVGTLLIATTGCSNTITDPELPSGAVRFTPPGVYATWWAMTQQCSGLASAMSDVAWYVVPGADSVVAGGEGFYAYWSLASNRIVLAGRFQRNGGIVRHEMLHALLQQDGHPRSAFLAACGGVVLCPSPCIADGGPAPTPDPTWPVVPAESTEVTVVVSPPAPSAAQYDGTFMVIVNARNPTSHGVVVQLDSAGLVGSGSVAFTAQIQQPGTFRLVGTDAIDSAVAYFAPGETKRMIFDFTINAGPSADPFGVLPGTYQLYGGFARFLSAAATLVVGP